MPESYDFEPDARRARRLDHDMHAGLGDSLAYLSEAASGHVAFDKQALRSLAERLRRGVRHGPAAFAHYYDLAPALEEGDGDRAAALFSRLAKLEPAPDGFEVLPISDPRLSDLAASYRSKLDTDPLTRFEFRDPPEEMVGPFRRRFFEGLGLLEQVTPELAGEVHGLLGQIILAVGPEKAAYVFDGGSSYMLWGMLVLNARFHETRVQMAEVIAHESAHTLLFGFTVQEPLTFNDDKERYASPLRRDPRPMDGIYHATFVSARMHWVMSRLAEAGVLTAQEKDEALAAAAADARNFASGYATIAEHGELSEAGEALIKNARAYMLEAAPEAFALQAG